MYSYNALNDFQLIPPGLLLAFIYLFFFSLPAAHLFIYNKFFKVSLKKLGTKYIINMTTSSISLDLISRPKYGKL